MSNPGETEETYDYFNPPHWDRWIQPPLIDVPYKMIQIQHEPTVSITEALVEYHFQIYKTIGGIYIPNFSIEDLNGYAQLLMVFDKVLSDSSSPAEIELRLRQVESRLHDHPLKIKMLMVLLYDSLGLPDHERHIPVTYPPGLDLEADIRNQTYPLFHRLRNFGLHLKPYSLAVYSTTRLADQITRFYWSGGVYNRAHVVDILLSEIFLYYWGDLGMRIEDHV